MHVKPGLKNGAPKHVIAFSHIPPFIEKPDEESLYFNWESDLRKETLEKLSSAGCSHWFCGHFHRNAGGKFIPQIEGDQVPDCLEVVVTSA